jgi:hypothetical protein
LQRPRVIAGVVGAACLVALVAITSWLVLPRSGPTPSPSDTPQASVVIAGIIKKRSQAASPTFSLTQGGQRTARSNPSIDDIASAVRAAAARTEDPFLVLTRSEQEFIQAYYERDKSWRLEYRAGSLQFFCDQPPDIDHVIKAMQLYREDNAGWAEICKWQALKLER